MTLEEMENKLGKLEEIMCFLVQHGKKMNDYVQGLCLSMENFFAIADPTMCSDTIEDFKLRVETLKQQMQLDAHINTINKIASATLHNKDKIK